MPILLADGAPTGAGLAIVGLVLLAFLAVALGVVILVVRWAVRRARSSTTPADP